MNRHILTVFCDDIRHEIGGKLSYIGVYSGGLFVPTFPITLPKLCLAMSVVTPADKPFRRLSVRVLKGEEQLAEGILDEAQLANVIDATDDVPESERKDRMQVLQTIFMFSPFQLDGPCVLRVRAETEEGALRGLGLRIEQAPGEALPVQ
ncbi:MAG: hypothetical protein AB1768_18635 [Pseudomonadota bacterium]|jgi:hypothetical protein